MLQQLSDDARIVVAEPTADLPGAWNEEPEASYGVAGQGDGQLRPLKRTAEVLIAGIGVDVSASRP